MKLYQEISVQQERLILPYKSIKFTMRNVFKSMLFSATNPWGYLNKYTWYFKELI